MFALSPTNVCLILLSFSFNLALCSPANAENPRQGEAYPIWKLPQVDQAAESYFSPDAKSLIFNAKEKGDNAHHTYTMTLKGKNLLRMNDIGEDACSFYFPDGKKIIYTSTKDLLKLPAGNWSDPTNYPQGAELYMANIDGSGQQRLTDNLHYDAEVSVSPDGRWILFTRQIEEKLDLWRMRSNGSDEQQITHTAALQEGGAFYMPDSKTILYRAWDIEDDGKRGKDMAIFTIEHDGRNLQKITMGSGMHWAPYPLPNGKHFVYVKMLPPHNFELFVMNIASRAERRLTHHPGFDGFPSISADGKTLSFSSSRDAKPRERKLSLYLMDLQELRLP